MTGDSYQVQRGDSLSLIARRHRGHERRPGQPHDDRDLSRQSGSLRRQHQSPASPAPCCGCRIPPQSRPSIRAKPPGKSAGSPPPGRAAVLPLRLPQIRGCVSCPPRARAARVAAPPQRSARCATAWPSSRPNSPTAVACSNCAMQNSPGCRARRLLQRLPSRRLAAVSEPAEEPAAAEPPAAVAEPPAAEAPAERTRAEPAAPAGPTARRSSQGPLVRAGGPAAAALLAFLGLRAARRRRENELDAGLGAFGATAVAARDSSSNTLPLRKPVVEAGDRASWSRNPARISVRTSARRARSARSTSTKPRRRPRCRNWMRPPHSSRATRWPKRISTWPTACTTRRPTSSRLAIDREPQRRDLKLKLLEVFFVWGNKDQFLQTARDSG